MIWGIFIGSLVVLPLFGFAEFIIFFLMFLELLLISTQPTGVFSGLIVDHMTMGMIFLSIFVSSMTLLTSSVSGVKMPLVLLLSMVVVNFFFSTDNFVHFFIFFEASLIPLLSLILGWGTQAERLKATQYMMMYTLISSFPLFVAVVYLSKGGEVLSLSPFLYESSGGVLLSLSVLAFLVKIPMFLVHSWLPKAHVEAPLEGSMVLAGVMLKVGVYGLIRTFFSLKISDLFCLFLLCVGAVGSISSLVVALSSDDMKMSVAFSSISHMNAVLSSVFSGKMMGLESAVIIMITHGICSPLLFYFVTKIYSFSSSRSILLSKGLVSKFPFLYFMGSFLWFMNLSVPPFFSFLGEFFSFLSLVSFSILSISWVVIFLFLSSFYSVVNLGVQGHSGKKLLVKVFHSDYIFSLLFFMVFSINLLMFFFHFGVL